MLCPVCAKSFDSWDEVANHMTTAEIRMRAHLRYMERLGFDWGAVLYATDLKKMAQAIREDQERP